MFFSDIRKVLVLGLGKSGCAEVHRSEAVSALDWLCCGPALCVCPRLKKKGGFQTM